MEYLIKIVGTEAFVVANDGSVCGYFCGKTFKADAIRCVLRKGGKFRFEEVQK